MKSVKNKTINSNPKCNRTNSGQHNKKSHKTIAECRSEIVKFYSKNNRKITKWK